jgi:hypothetical protein
MNHNNVHEKPQGTVLNHDSTVYARHVNFFVKGHEWNTDSDMVTSLCRLLLPSSGCDLNNHHTPHTHTHKISYKPYLIVEEG